MKIVKEGQLPGPTPPWWTQVDITCPQCGAVIRLEEGDSITTTRTPGAPISFPCPTTGCRQIIEVSAPVVARAPSMPAPQPTSTVRLLEGEAVEREEAPWRPDN